MTDKPIRIPGPDHPITIARNPARVIARAGESVIADSRHALALREARYPVAHYLPRDDAAMASLERSDHTSYCPYKGEASYFHIPSLGERGTNAVWSYEQPYPAVAEIAGHLAFYSDRVTISEETAADAPA